jgi:hypothetical protein
MNNHGAVLSNAVIRFSVPGFHNWPGASGVRAYLADRHRHLFLVEVELQVFHEEREVEFHDLLDFCKTAFPGGDMEGQSCETMATGLYKEVAGQYPDRRLVVSVFEDGEVGAKVYSIS